MHGLGLVNGCLKSSVVLCPQALPSFSMLHAEKLEGLILEVTCVT